MPYMPNYPLDSRKDPIASTEVRGPASVPTDSSVALARCYVTQSVQEGDVGVLVPLYNTQIASAPTYQLSTTSSGLALNEVREIGVVKFAPGDTGGAGTFVDVVTSGTVMAKIMTGTNHSVASAGDALEYSVGGAGAFIRSTLGAASRYCVAVALQPAAVGTQPTSKVTANVFIPKPIIMVNTTSTANW